MEIKRNGVFSRAALTLLVLVLSLMLLLPVYASAQESEAAEIPAAEQTAAEEPVVEEVVAEEPVAEETVTEEPVSEESVVEETVTEEPVSEEPVSEEPVVEEPVAEEPVSEEPVVEETETEEPVSEEPVVEETVPEEPVAEEPVTGESSAQQSEAPEFAYSGANSSENSSDGGGETAAEGETEEEGSKGSAYLKGDNDEWTLFENGEAGNAIQQAVDAAIKAGKSSITVVVQDGTYSGGINIDNSGENNSSIVVNIVAHDAYEKPADASNDNSEAVYPVPTDTDGGLQVNADSSGGVKLEDGISVRNVELLLAGIYLSLKEQKENQEKMEEAASGDGAAAQSIVVEDSESFTYYGTAQGDAVDIKLTDVADTYIDSGAGDDVVSTDISYTPTVDYNSVTAGAAPSQIVINTGDGSDILTINKNNDIEEKDGSILVSSVVTNLNVDAGAGADTISLSGSSNLIDIDSALAKSVKEIAAGKLASVTNTARIVGGEGDDLLKLDTGWELGSFGKTAVDYDGGEGKNRLHLSGGLDASADNKITASLSEDGSGSISMKTESTLSKTEYRIADTELWFNKIITELKLKGSLDVTMSGVSALTDELSGKDTVNVSISGGKLVADGADVILRPFTDYVLELGDGSHSIGSISCGEVSGLLTKLHIKGQHLTVDEDTVIKLPGVSIVLETVDGAYDDASITIRGHIEADNILLKLTKTDSRSISFLEVDGEDVLGMDPSIMDANSSVRVTIAATAKLIASRVVDIAAKSIQNHGLLPDLTDLIPGLGDIEGAFEDLPEDHRERINGYIEKAFGVNGLTMLGEAASINFVSIKMAGAVIDILGSIIADSVRVSAGTSVDTTASNSALNDLGLPLALSVILGEAGINVSGDDAEITARSGDIYLDARSEINVNTNAKSGRLPFTLAVSVVDNEAYVDISGGTLRSTDGSIIANACGTVSINTTATGDEKSEGGDNNAVVSDDNQASENITRFDKGKSGGFFAISVLDQDVFSALRGTASAIAQRAAEDCAGNISLGSTARAGIVNNSSSNPGEDGDSMTLAGLIKTLSGDEEIPGDGGLLGSLINKLTAYFDGKKNQTQSEEEKAALEEEKKEKTGVLGSFIDKLTGEGGEGDDVASLVDKATTSANTGKTDSTHTVQLVGALAVTYADNNNKAYIETEGEVSAQGSLSVLADGEMSVETLADGSPVEADDPGAGEKEESGPQDQHFAGHNHGAVKVGKLTNGSIIIDASVGEADENSYELVENNSFPKGLNIGDTFNFVVRASFGYTLSKDSTGYYITNEFIQDGAIGSEKIYVKLIGKDADGCYLYRTELEGYAIDSGDNLFKAEFVPKNSITVTNNAPHMGSVEITDAQTDGRTLYFAELGDEVYVKINLKSGVSITAPYISYLVEGSSTAQPVTVTEIIKGEVKEDGTVDYFYGFSMPEGNVTVDVKLSGTDMNIRLDLEEPAERAGDVWICPAEAEPEGSAMDAQSLYAGKVGDKIKIVIQLANATYLVENSLVFAGKTPVYIKDISYDGENQYTCFVNIPAILKTEGDSSAANELRLSFRTTLDPNEAQGSVEDRGTALGAGLAVDVTRYNNQAYIAKTGNNSISAESLEVKANTSALAASAMAMSGFVAADLGVAGAICVHLVSANNEALVGGSMEKISIDGGDLTVESVVENSNIVTNAEAAGDGAGEEETDPDSTGVGAGIAVGVTNIAVSSRILDTVELLGNIGNMSISAAHNGSESMNATAGASGGSSAVPVLALNISGVSVLADSGKKLDNELKLEGDVLIKAANSITRTIIADAAAVGGGVGVGASFIIDILKDSAKAKLGRGVNSSGNLTVSAESVSRLNATAKSGAQGSVGEEAGDEDSGGGDGEGQPSEEPPPSEGSDKKEELPDDYYGGLDDLFGDDPDISLDEDDDPESLAPLFREGDADKFVDSNKQSAQDLSGLVSNSNGNINSADVGDAFENRQKAETSEGSVQVAATMVLNIQSNEAHAMIDEVSSVSAGEVSVTSRHDTDGVIMADASATNSTTGVGVAVAINTVDYTNLAEILTDKITASKLTVRADIFEAEAEDSAEEIFEAIKNEVLTSKDSIEKFVDDVMKAAGKGSLREFVGDYIGKLAVENSKEIENSVVQLIVQWAGELIQGKKPSFPTAEQQDNIKNQALEYGKEVFNEVKSNFSLEKLVSVTLGDEGLMGKIKEIKANIKDINLKERAAAAAFSYLAGKLGGNDEAEGMGPMISTSAASGAGAADVGVAGSVAISVVNGVSGAHIADAAEGELSVEGDIVVESKAAQDVYTSAGSSVDALGRVDKNKEATDTANSTQSGDANSTSGKSVGVGAAVAMSFAELRSDAGIGKGWKISARDLLMDAHAENNVETTSVSGTDPLARTEAPGDKTDEMLTEEEKKEKAEEKAAKAMDYAVDASVAVTLIDNIVRTFLEENSVITLLGKLNMLSGQSGTTNTNASGFAMGSDTAVGAAAAINLAFSEVLTSFEGSGTVADSATLDSTTENQDDAAALALAMGAEMDRYFAKIRNAEKVKAFNKDQEDTEHEDDKRVRIENETSNKVSAQLKRASAVKDDEQKDTNAALPLSVQAIKSQDVKTESTNQTDSSKVSDLTGTVTGSSNENAGTAVNGALTEQAQEGQSIHVAAAVGVNVTEHKAETRINGKLSAGGISSTVENTGSFSTVATGAAVSEAGSSNTVGVAVAVSVNGNEARIAIADNIRLEATGTSDDMGENGIIGNVALETILNQNSTGDALGKYGALAVAGSSSGKGGKVGLAGSVAIMVVNGASSVILGDNVGIEAASGAVSIAASDKSKLSAAAMAATSSDGVTAGVGASFALLYAQNEVLAKAGDDFSVNAGSFNMSAVKHAVDLSDFESATGLRDIISLIEVDGEGNGAYDPENADSYGMIVLQKNQNGSYSLFTNLNTDNILDLIQWTSALASVNYYASAVAGTVMERTGDSSNQKAAVAGAVSMLFNKSLTEALIGDNARITSSGETRISASGETNTRLLGGALSSSGAKAGVGLNVATAKQLDKVAARIGEHAEIEAESFELSSLSLADMLVLTAAAVSASGNSVGGTLNLVINNSGSESSIGDDAKISGDLLVRVSALTGAEVVLGSLNLVLSGAEQGAAAGGIVSVTTNDSSAIAGIGDRARITSGHGGIIVESSNEELIVNVLAAASRSGGGAAGAGTVNVLSTDARSAASIGDEAKLSALRDIAVTALSEAKLINIMLAAAMATDAAAVGAGVMVNSFGRETVASIGDNADVVSRLGSLHISAQGKEDAFIISVAGSASSQTAISGNIQVNVGGSSTSALIGSNALIRVWDSIGVTAYQDSRLISIGANAGLSTGGSGGGATVQTSVLENSILALIGENADLAAYAQNTEGGIQSPSRQERRKGIILSALSKDLVVVVGISAASAGGAGLAGVVETVVNRNITRAGIGAGSKASSGFSSGDSVDSAAFGEANAESSEGELSAEADSDSTLVIFGGALEASTGSGVGATVLTLVYDKTLEARLLMDKAVVTGAVRASANAGDTVALVAVSFGFSSNSALSGGGSILVFRNTVDSALSGSVTARADVSVLAESSTKLVNAAASCAGSLAGASVSGAVLVTYFMGKTRAVLMEGSDIRCARLNVKADTVTDIDSDGIGITASVGSAAASGLVNIIVTGSLTEASVGKNTKIDAENVSVIATDKYDLLAIAVSLSGASSAGVGVTAVVTVAKNTVSAFIAEGCTVNAEGSVSVNAVSEREIGSYAGSVAAGSTAGAGVTVMVAAIGGKLDKDSAEGIAKGFRPDAFMDNMKANTPDAAKTYLDDIDLEGDLEAEGSKASDLNIGDESGNYTGTDGYRSDEFDEKYSSGSNPGEEVPENAANRDGAELGLDKPQGQYENVISAYIAENCIVNVKGDIIVEADEKLNVDIVTASAAIGGTAGVNVGVAVVVAHSNVLAEIRSGSSVICGGNLKIRAASGGDGRISDSHAAEVLKKAGINAESSGSSIRAIAITVAAGGTAAVSPAVAAVNMASAAIARMDGVSGSVTGKNKSIEVKAETVYPNVLAVTGSIGGGTAGVSASVAVVSFNSLTYAGVINSGVITSRSLSILSVVDNTAKAYAATLAGGIVGVNGALALVVNRSSTDTVLGRGRYETDNSSVGIELSSNVNTAAESYIVSVAVGFDTVGLNAAVVNQAAKINTQVLGDANSNINSRSLTVLNKVNSTGKALVVAVSGGAVSVGANVLLVFNDTGAEASVSSMPLNIWNMLCVSSTMNADAKAELTSAVAGGVSVGLSTSYVGLNAKNLAYLEIPENFVCNAQYIKVLAGDAKDPGSFNASAGTVAGQGGGVNVGLNAAVADINAANEAKLISRGTLGLSGSVEVMANANAKALAEIFFISLGGVNVSAATAVSLLRMEQTALAEIDSLSADSLKVSSLLNQNRTGGIAPSRAILNTGSVGLYNANANVAVAYGLSRSLAKAVLNTADIAGGIEVNSSGSADVLSKTANEAPGLFTGSVFINVAYGKGSFDSVLQLKGGQVDAGSASVNTSYWANSHASLTPSASELDISIGSFDVNLAIAKTAAKALAAVEGVGVLNLSRSFSLTADGSNSSALADIIGGKTTESGLKFGANHADARMALEQEVRLAGISVNAGGQTEIRSKTENLAARAETGSNSGEKLVLVGGDVNTAEAEAYLINRILIENAKLISGGEVNLEALSAHLSVLANAKAVGFELSGLDSSVTQTCARVSKLNTLVTVKDSTISGKGVYVSSKAGNNANGTNEVIALSSVPRTKASLIGLKSILATAEIVEKLTQIIFSGSDISSTAADITVSASSDAFMKACSAHPGTSIGAVSVNDYRFNVKVGRILSEIISDSSMDSSGSVKMNAYDNLEAETVIDSGTVGGFTKDTGVAKISVDDVTAHIRAAGSISASKNIDILSKADQQLKSIVDNSALNITGRGYAKADIILCRNSIVDVSGDITSDNGNISIRALLDDRDTDAENGEKVIFIDVSVALDTYFDLTKYPEGTGKLVSTAKVNVDEGSRIQVANVFDDSTGNITIIANSAGNVLVRLYRYVDKMVGNNSGHANADIQETVAVSIGDKLKTVISGINVTISAQSEMVAESRSECHLNANVGKNKPIATLIFRSDIDTVIRGADIGAHRKLDISSRLPYARLKAYSFAEKDWAFSQNEPKATVKGNIYADVTLDDYTVLRAAVLNVKAFRAYDSENNVQIDRVETKESHGWIDGGGSSTKTISFNTTWASTKEAFEKGGTKWTDFCKGALFVPGTYNPNKNDENRVFFSGKLSWSAKGDPGVSNPSGKTEIYLGAGANGIVIDISSDDVVRVRGLDGSVEKDQLICLKDGVYHVDGSRLIGEKTKGTYSFVFTAEQGTYKMDESAGNGDLSLSNKSSHDVQLNNVNERADAATNSGAYLKLSQTDPASDLIFSGGGSFAHGSILVDMAGGDLILRDGAHINASDISISGVGSLKDEGREDGKFHITNSGTATKDNSLNIDVDEDLYLLVSTDSKDHFINKVNGGGNVTLEILGNKVKSSHVGSIKAGGTAALIVSGSVSGGSAEAPAMSGEHVEIKAGAAIGSKQDHFFIDSVNGVFALTDKGGIYLTEVSGDLTVSHITDFSSGDIVLETLDGNIRDSFGNKDIIEDMDDKVYMYLAYLRKAFESGDKEEILTDYIELMESLRDRMLAADAQGALDVLNEGRSKINILHNVDTVEEALQVLNKNIADSQVLADEYFKLFFEYLEKGFEMGAKASDRYEYILENPNASIITDGNLSMIVNSLSGAASVGSTENAIGVSVQGNISVKAAGGTVLDTVVLNGYEPMYLLPMEAEYVELHGLNGIYTGDLSRQDIALKTPVITAHKLVLRSVMGGNVGMANKVFRTGVDVLDIIAGSVFIDNNKSLVVDLILTSDDVELTVKGDLTDSDDYSAAHPNTDGLKLSGIHAERLKLNVSGAIGQESGGTEQPAAENLLAAPASGNALDISISKDVSIKASTASIASYGSIIIDNISTSGQLTIVTDGAINGAASDSKVVCGALTADAYGYVGNGKSPITVYSNGIVNANSFLYGDNLRILPMAGGTGFGYTPAAGGVNHSVSGDISSDSRLLVSYAQLHRACAGCEYLWSRHLAESLPYAVISLSGDYEGVLTVRIDLGAGRREAEGDPLVVLTCRDGVIYAIRAYYRNGCAVFESEELGVFLVLSAESSLDITEDGRYILGAEGQKLPFGGWL